MSVPVPYAVEVLTVRIHRDRTNRGIHPSGGFTAELAQIAACTARGDTVADTLRNLADRLEEITRA